MIPNRVNSNANITAQNFILYLLRFREDHIAEDRKSFLIRAAKVAACCLRANNLDHIAASILVGNAKSLRKSIVAYNVLVASVAEEVVGYDTLECSRYLTEELCVV